VLFRGGRTITSLAVLVEPYGTRSFPDIHTLDMRFDKRFSLGRGRSLSARMNLYNVMNVSTATDIDFRSGATFGLTEAILPPRIMDFGFVFTY
jgi:hypothetical protein